MTNLILADVNGYPFYQVIIAIFLAVVFILLLIAIIIMLVSGKKKNADKELPNPEEKKEANKTISPSTTSKTINPYNDLHHPENFNLPYKFYVENTWVRKLPGIDEYNADPFYVVMPKAKQVEEKETEEIQPVLDSEPIVEEVKEEVKDSSLIILAINDLDRGENRLVEKNEVLDESSEDRSENKIVRNYNFDLDNSVKSVVKEEVVEEKEETEQVEEVKEEPVVEETKEEVEEEKQEVKEEEKELKLKDVTTIADKKGSAILEKEEIANHLSEKYGDKVNVNTRPAITKNGKLMVADTHYKVFDDSKSCFAYVYKTKSGNIFFIFNSNKDKCDEILASHPEFSKSSFPKSKNTQWLLYIPSSDVTSEEIYSRLDEMYELYSK